MSERLTAHHESHKNLDLHELAQENLKRTHEHAEKSSDTSTAAIEKLAETVHKQAKSRTEYASSEKESTPATHTFGAHQALKNQSYKQTLTRIRSRLNGPEKSFSKVIHNKGIDKASSVGAQTVARPLGILFGGLFAFVGSSIALFTARHAGFRYNFSIFIVLFVGGYLVGTLVEFLKKVLKRS